MESPLEIVMTKNWKRWIVEIRMRPENNAKKRSLSNLTSFFYRI